MDSPVDKFRHVTSKINDEVPVLEQRTMLACTSEETIKTTEADCSMIMMVIKQGERMWN
jgi:hypothetical protein